jgi:PAS domain S-box-containing protein
VPRAGYTGPKVAGSVAIQMEVFWRLARQAALRVWRQGGALRCEPNEAALQWVREQGLAPDELAAGWEQLALRVLAAPDAGARRWRLGEDGPAFDGQALVVADGALLWWLPPATPEAPDSGQGLWHSPMDRRLHHRDPALFALAAAGVGVWRRLDDLHSYWSEAMYRLRGLDPADTRPISLLAEQCLHPEDRVAWQQISRRYNDNSRPDALHEWEFRVVWPDGSVHWLASRGRTVSAAEGGARYMTGINVDVTERHQAQAHPVGVPGPRQPRAAHADECRAGLLAADGP